MDELISIIVPIYNVHAYLRECLDSLICQTYHNLEIVLVDDGSYDGSSEICDEYALADNRVIVIHKKNEGLVKARKTGLLSSTGTIIGYVDGDDWIELNMIEEMYNVMKTQKVDVVICGRYEDFGDSKREIKHGFSSGMYNKRRLKEDIYPYMIENGGFFTWGIMPNVWDKLYKRECIEPYQMKVEDSVVMGEDAACVYPCLLDANSLYIMDECFYHYRQSTDSMIKVSNRNDEGVLISNLFYSVDGYFKKIGNPYNIREQWLDYVLFLLIPRMENTYRNLAKLPFLFPYPKVKKGYRIIIYGMGTYGQLLEKYILRSGEFELIATVDSNYETLNCCGLNVIAPQKIGELQYDAIIIASSFSKTRNAIYNNLCLQYPKDKIHVMDENLIHSRVTLEAFGLCKQ